MAIIYHTGNLFEIAPKNAILVHACNSIGVWKSGIAKEFAKRFPDADYEYWEKCSLAIQDTPKRSFVGTAKVWDERGTDQLVGGLFTSHGYGKLVDPPHKVLANTKTALIDFLEKYETNYADRPVYSNQFNSGLFNVPWEYTEQLINQIWPYDWNVVILPQGEK